MIRLKYYSLFLAACICAAMLAAGAFAKEFDIPAGDLKAALDAYSQQSGVALIVSDEAVKGAHSKGARGDLSSEDALTRILAGTGFVMYRHSANVIGIGRSNAASANFPASDTASVHLAAAPAASVSGAALETVTVTSSKVGGDIQNIPISITALSQEQLTATQTAGGPDLIKQVPNMTFTKTNFTGYNIEIRGIGTQAISVTTDPAVAVAFNDIPFLRNHFFEQEFYDVSQVEVLRGPQGTLYGRNATAGVVNLVSAKPTDQFEAMASVDIGNFQNRRIEGMLNIPIADDRLDLRVAGEWTKRNGYTQDTTTNTSVDGRDLWSGRATISLKLASNIQTYLVWEHFSEDDDRLRSGKQLCEQAPVPSEVGGVPVSGGGVNISNGAFLSQGCLASTSLYSPTAFEVPDPAALPYWTGPVAAETAMSGVSPYSGGEMQSANLRQIESQIPTTYRAKNDTLEYNADWSVSPDLTFTSQTGYNQDFLWSTEDYNRFGSNPGVFNYIPHAPTVTSVQYPGPTWGTNPNDPSAGGIFCDPQLGCSDRLEAEDLSNEHAWQLAQEFRLASHFGGPLNFSFGGNYLHYETEENYYVFINSLTVFSYNDQFANIDNYVPGETLTNSNCLLPGGFRYPDPSTPTPVLGHCPYVDPNPITSLDNEGHNYFLSQNPYTLNSYAIFGELYYDIAKDLKLTAGLRWTIDQKHFLDIPSEVVLPGYGYTVTNIVNQQWSVPTGRAALNWTPKLDFTDQTLIYASAAHGYKAGGANPPGAIYPFTCETVGACGDETTDPIHPLTFKPEYIEAFELGTKNTLLDGALTLNGDAFYYNYAGYQISEIVDRTAINNNFNGHVEGAEFESTWEPLPGLKFSVVQGFENTHLAGGDHAVDLLDRAAGIPDWIVVKPFVTEASNCILPDYVVAAVMQGGGATENLCDAAYTGHIDPVTGLPYVLNPTVTSSGGSSAGGAIPEGYPGFDPLSIDPAAPANVNNGLGLPPNNGAGFDKNVGGNQLPDAPHFTTSLTAEYTMPASESWAATLHGDFYWQSQQWARVFEDAIDKIRPYSTTNLSMILTNQNGWQAMAYVKNVFNVTAITGTFLNSDDTGLTTNVFLTDPRLIGIRVTKNW